MDLGKALAAENAADGIKNTSKDVSGRKIKSAKTQTLGTSRKTEIVGGRALLLATINSQVAAMDPTLLSYSVI